MSSSVFVSIQPPLLESCSDSFSHADSLSFRHPSAKSEDMLLSFDSMYSNAFGECLISAYESKYFVICGLVHITSVKAAIS